MLTESVAAVGKCLAQVRWSPSFFGRLRRAGNKDVEQRGFGEVLWCVGGWE